MLDFERTRAPGDDCEHVRPAGHVRAAVYFLGAAAGEGVDVFEDAVDYGLFTHEHHCNIVNGRLSSASTIFQYGYNVDLKKNV